MTHDFESLGSVQWGMMGLSPTAAATDYRCRKCGAEWTHRYNSEPNFYAAMESAGIPLECTAELPLPAQPAEVAGEGEGG